MIKQMSKNLRPREKCIKYGVDKLTDEECLAILIRTGVGNVSCLDIAATILNKYPLNQLANVSIKQLKNFYGISDVKAIELITVIEIAKRMSKQITYHKKLNANDPSIVVDYMRTHYGTSMQEVFVIFYLDSGSNVIKIEEFSKGTSNHVAIYPKEIFKKAIQLNASYLIFSHNHPSGNCQPSNDDLYLTCNLSEAARLMDIVVLDHVIVSMNEYYSFSENGRL